MDPEQLQVFEAALHALLETLQPTPQADHDRRLVLADMQQLVGKALPPEFHCSVETFGSYRAGLHLPGSDLDFALAGYVVGPEGQQIELHEWSSLEQQYVLEDLADALEQHELVVGKVERVLHARVPVIKFRHRETGMACDFSINRPECTFKAEMQKLLGSLDRRYAALYRLVKAWAAAHGVNDAAAQTLNSWSLGLMVVFYLQCGTAPAVLPPVWQLVEREAPDVRQPRILQLPSITSATLKRVLTKASAGAGAYASRRAMAGADAVNPKSIGQLLAGFFEFYAPCLADWCEGRNSNWRASTWWGEWKEAAWFPAKSFIFSIEDPFNAGDNTARSVGTRNQLSSCQTAAYISATFAASSERLQHALLQDSSSSSAEAGPQQRDVQAAFAWLFGPHMAWQLCGGEPPHPAPLQLAQHIPDSLCQQLRQQLEEELQDCMELLSSSSSLINSNNSSVATHPLRVQRVEQALGLYRQLMKALGCQQHHVCLGDFVLHRRELERQQADERERQRQEQLKQQDALQQQQQQADERERRRQDRRKHQEALQQQTMQMLQQAPQHPDVVAAMQGLKLGSPVRKPQQQQVEQQNEREQRQRQRKSGSGAMQQQSSAPEPLQQPPQARQGGRGKPENQPASSTSTTTTTSSRSTSSSSVRQASVPAELRQPAHQQPLSSQQVLVGHHRRSDGEQQKQQQRVPRQQQPAERQPVSPMVADVARGGSNIPAAADGAGSRGGHHQVPTGLPTGGARLAANALSGLVIGKPRNAGGRNGLVSNGSRKGSSSSGGGGGGGPERSRQPAAEC